MFSERIIRRAIFLALTAAVASLAPAASAEQAIGLWLTTVKQADRSGHGLQGKRHALDGVASYYWQDQMTATGERFDKTALTAAHPTLPFGSKVRVTRVDTGKSVVVRINDRGPFKPGRVIDLSERAAQEINMTGRGLASVKLEVLSN
jgi:rare lipoprotein A (peptidoglycan hydrolase)